MILRAVAALVLVCAVARADAQKPWAQGVSAEKQAKALALYDEGNKRVAQDDCVGALVKYSAALESWDHPAIHYNAALCFAKLGRELDAYNAFEASLKFGPEPLGNEHFVNAGTQMAQLHDKIAELAVRCSQEKAEVRLDGELVTACPGSGTKRALVGSHHLVAAKPQYETDTRDIVLHSGVNELEITLKPLPGRRLVRRWDTWKPWAIAAGGAAIAAAGGGLMYAARQFDFNTWVTQNCNAANMYCQAMPQVIADKRSEWNREKTENAIGIGAVAIGGAALVAGVAMIYLNQGRMVEVVPTASAEHAGVTLVFQY